MVRYLLSVIGPAEYTPFGAYESETEWREAMTTTAAFSTRLEVDGVLIFVDALAPAATSTVVDGRGPKPLLTDGPYLEAEEHLNGIWIIDVLDLDAAIEYAAAASAACRGRIEVRPFYESA